MKSIRLIDWQDTMPLRHKVLWPEKPIAFCKVEDDETATHYGYFIDNKLVCVASIFIDGASARLRKFATLPEYQGQGIGTQVIQQALKDLETKAVNYFWCDARESAAGFYEKFGMRPQGERFYKGDIPYFEMGVDLINQSYKLN